MLHFLRTVGTRLCLLLLEPRCRTILVVLYTRCNFCLMSWRNYPIVSLLVSLVCKSKSKSSKLPSTIEKAVALAETMGIPPPNHRSTPKTSPAWRRHEDIITILNSLNKSSTSNDVYKQMFLELRETYKPNKCAFMCNDGSKTVSGVSFAVVAENGNTLSKRLLPAFACFQQKVVLFHVPSNLQENKKQLYAHTVRTTAHNVNSALPTKHLIFDCTTVQAKLRSLSPKCFPFLPNPVSS